MFSEIGIMFYVRRLCFIDNGILDIMVGVLSVVFIGSNIECLNLVYELFSLVIFVLVGNELII